MLAAAALWMTEFNLFAFVIFTTLAGGILSFLYLWLGEALESTRVSTIGVLGSRLKGQKSQDILSGAYKQEVDPQKRAIPYGLAIFAGSAMVLIQSGMR